MSESLAVTVWMQQLASGDERAAEQLWKVYFDRMVRLAQRKFAGAPRRSADEEDVALSAMKSFLHGMTEGKFAWVADRDDLWKLLVTITARKVCHRLREQMAQKRGGGEVRGESVFALPDHDEQRGIEQVLGPEPTPQFAAEVSEECQRMLDGLGDETLRQIAVYRLEGYTNEEIADKLQCAVRTVERKLDRIRAKWSRRTEASPNAEHP